MSFFSRINFLSVPCILSVCLTVITSDAQIKITAGYKTSYFVNVNNAGGSGVTYGCGSNESYQLWDNMSSYTVLPGKVASCGSCHQQEPKRYKSEGVSDIAPSKFGSHVLGMGFSRTPGKVLSIGANDYGQLGNGTNLLQRFPLYPHGYEVDYNNIYPPMASNANGIAAGYGTSFIITADNKLIAYGRNSSGQLGIGTYNDEQSGVYVKNEANGQDLTNVKSVSAGSDHTLILDHDGSVYACGLNWGGLCGLGSGTYDMNKAKKIEFPNGATAKKVAASSSHSLVLMTDGKVFGFGWTPYGQLGFHSYNAILSPIEITTGATDIEVGGLHSLILKGNTLWAAGINNDGQLGDGTTDNKINFVQVVPNQTIGSGVGVVSMAAGYDHTVIQTTDGKFWACGNNEYGQLGDGTTTNQTAFVPVRLHYQYKPHIINTYGTIEAEDYDIGINKYFYNGDGCSYNDNSTGNTGGSYRSDDVDIENVIPGVTNVGWIDAGEWMEYTCNVPAGGTYTITLRAASPYGNKDVKLYQDGAEVATFTVSNTGDWYYFNSFTATGTLSTNTQSVLRLECTDGAYNIDWISFTRN